MEKKDVPSPVSQKPDEPIKTPDISVLERYSPTGGAQSHPDWVKAKFPAYIASHGGTHGQEATSVRQFTHNGHDVKIITTYRIEVDGKPAGMHLSVDDEGQVYTHATPFVTYGSAVDLMKNVMDAYPGAFSDTDPHADHEHGDNHHANKGEQS